MARAATRSVLGTAVSTESALILGLLIDLLSAPFWIASLLLGRGRIRDGLRPLIRIAEFALAARATAALIALNLAGFAVELYARLTGMPSQVLARRLGLDLHELLNGNVLSLVTHLFAHASPSHLVANLLALVVFGRTVERHLGPLRVFGAFALAGLTSSLLSLLEPLWFGGPSLPSLGASGAVAGLLALGILLEPLSLTFESLIPLPLCVVGILTMTPDLLGLLRGAAGQVHDGIDHAAHLGGYLVAPLYYFSLPRALKRRARLGLLLSLGTAALLFAVRMWARLRG